MKNALPLLAAFMLALPAAPVWAQSQEAQQACEGDVYDLCGDKVPDRDAIEACLRKKFSKVSKECRHFMEAYSKSKRHSPHKRRSNGAAGMGNVKGY